MKIQCTHCSKKSIHYWPIFKSEKRYPIQCENCKKCFYTPFAFFLPIKFFIDSGLFIFIPIYLYVIHGIIGLIIGIFLFIVSAISLRTIDLLTIGPIESLEVKEVREKVTTTKKGLTVKTEIILNDEPTLKDVNRNHPIITKLLIGGLVIFILYQIFFH